MGPLLAGIAILLVVFLVPLPYILYVIGLIAGILLVIYGAIILFRYGPWVRGPVNRRGRWYY